MSLDKNSIDKEISRLGIEALMFWELPKVDNALHSMCKRWFFSACKAYNKTTLDLTADSQDASTSTPTIEPSNVIVAPQKEMSNLLNCALLKS